MDEKESKPVEVECPKCKHKFFHKLEAEAEKVLEGAVEIAAVVVTGGEPGVPR